MHPIDTISSHYIVIAADNVDTDQIIPARFLKGTDREGFGALVFHDRRYNADGSPNPDFAFNDRRAVGAAILVAGHNFGCGSSREHAPWALRSFGIEAVISSGFADIFRNNALKNGLLPVEIPRDVLHGLVRSWEESEKDSDPTRALTIDLASQTLIIDRDTTIGFPIDRFAKHCLLAGVDELDFLLAADADISAHEAQS
jgi:3-isopropylmalate/(R)-2-methylmalate dehydratase small subunit